MSMLFVDQNNVFYFFVCVCVWGGGVIVSVSAEK